MKLKWHYLDGAEKSLPGKDLKYHGQLILSPQSSNFTEAAEENSKSSFMTCRNVSSTINITWSLTTLLFPTPFETKLRDSFWNSENSGGNMDLMIHETESEDHNIRKRKSTQLVSSCLFTIFLISELILLTFKLWKSAAEVSKTHDPVTCSVVYSGGIAHRLFQVDGDLWSCSTFISRKHCWHQGLCFLHTHTHASTHTHTPFVHVYSSVREYLSMPWYRCTQWGIID